MWSAFFALLLLFCVCVCVIGCVRQTPSFPVSDDEQTQDEEYLKRLYDTRAINIIGAHYENAAQASTDYNHTVGRTGNRDYLRNREFRLNMVGNRILIAAYPMCPRLRRSRSMMVGISSGMGQPMVEWAITPFGQQDKATLKLGDEILGMGNEDIAPGVGGVLRARAVLADYANRMAPLKFRVQRDGEILRITQQPVKFCSYDFVLVKSDDDQFGADSNDKNIRVNQTAFNYLTTDDELAALIGHETAHNIMRHRPRKDWLWIGSWMASVFTLPADVLSGASERETNLMFEEMSRRLEDEADYVGIYLSAAAGYDPEGVLSLQEIMAHAYHNYITGSGDEDASFWLDSPPYWLSDHPPAGERYTQLRKAVEQIKLKQQEGLPVLPEFLD